jgi:hypothetical protein
LNFVLEELYCDYNLMTLNWGESFDVSFWKTVRQTLAREGKCFSLIILLFPKEHDPGCKVPTHRPLFMYRFRKMRIEGALMELSWRTGGGGFVR